MNVSSLVMFYNINKELAIQYFNYYSVAVAVISDLSKKKAILLRTKDGRTVMDLLFR